LKTDNPELNFRRENANFLAVEILPCVSLQLEWRATGSVSPQQDLFSEDQKIKNSNELTKSSNELAELGRILSRAFEIFNRLSAAAANEEKARVGKRSKQ
jgi:hypothetical protein